MIIKLIFPKIRGIKKLLQKSSNYTVVIMTETVVTFETINGKTIVTVKSSSSQSTPSSTITPSTSNGLLEATPAATTPAATIPCMHPYDPRLIVPELFGNRSRSSTPLPPGLTPESRTLVDDYVLENFSIGPASIDVRSRRTRNNSTTRPPMRMNIRPSPVYRQRGWDTWRSHEPPSAKRTPIPDPVPLDPGMFWR